MTNAPRSPGPPLWLLLELTYRCPLHCVFCYNPLDFASVERELATEDWLRVLREARALGAVQLGLSGGEPLVRDDLEKIVEEAHRLGFYVNLITSGVGLNESRIRSLKTAGLDHIQLSFQDSTREMNDFLSHTRTFDLKERVAALIKQYAYPMVLNCVLHRLNIDHVGAIIEMAERLGAEYLELANTQYYSWAHLNRERLLPSRSQLAAAERTTKEWRDRLDGRMKILFVVPDYYEPRPKRCVNGWGSTLMVVAPDGTALPCHTAKMLPGLAFPDVRTHSLQFIWTESEAFNRFRGTAWMKEPCASCDEREKDLGGCRCQAFLLANDATAADPVCAKSPHRQIVDRAVETAQRISGPHGVEQPLHFRAPPKQANKKTDKDEIV
jgi:PqqA peptide cyclase